MANRLNLSEALSIEDPFITHDWNVIFPTIPGSSLSSRQLSYRAQTSEIPGITIEPVVVTLKDVELSYALRQTWEKSLSMNFLEVRSQTTRDAFVNWAKLIRSVQAGKGLLKADYVVNLVMELYDATDSVTRTITICNAWPSAVGQMSLESPGSTAQLPVTFTYDYTLENGA